MRQLHSFCIHISNVSKTAETVTCLTSKFIFDGGEYDIYTQSNTWQNESLGAWQPLVTSVTGEIRGIRGSFGATPFFVIWNRQNNL